MWEVLRRKFSLEARCVYKGMKLLDANMPGWEQRVLLEDLNMSDPNWCVLGQVYDNGSVYSGYLRGLRELGIEGWSLFYGFLGCDEEWKRQITKRRGFGNCD